MLSSKIEGVLDQLQPQFDRSCLPRQADHVTARAYCNLHGL